MSYTSNYNLNIRLSNLESRINSGIPTSSDLADVLLNGNSAGATDIDMNNNNIQQVLNVNSTTNLSLFGEDNISLTTNNNDIDLTSTNGDINLDTPLGVVNINGVPYPPAVDDLSAVLTAGNTAVNTITLQDLTNPATLFSQMSDTGFIATDATGSPQYDASVSASNITVSNTNGDSNTLTAGTSTLVSGVGQNIISITGMNVDNLSSATDYSTAGINAGNQSSSIDYQIASLMASSTGYAKMDLTSGDLLTVPPRVLLEASVDYNAFPAYGSNNLNRLDLGTNTGDDIEIINGDEVNELPENRISLHQDGSYSNNYIRLRSAFDFVGISSFLTLGIDTFDLNISNQSAITIGNVATDPVIFRRNISTTTATATTNPVGMLENSVLNATTTGTSVLTVANAFATIVNTPTAGSRIFILPAPTAGAIGFWYAFCNKSIAFTIAVQYPSGTTIATIPVAPSATNGGSVARFAVQALGASYFRVN